MLLQHLPVTEEIVFLSDTKKQGTLLILGRIVCMDGYFKEYQA